MKRTWSVMVLALVALTAWAAQETALLVAKPRLGQVKDFSLEIEAQFDGQAVTLRSTVREAIQEVLPGGGYVVESTQVDGVAILGESEVPLPPSPATKTTHGPRGEVLKIEGDDVDESTYRLSNVTTLIVPPAAVPVGTNWVHEFEASAQGAVAAKATYTFAAIEDVGGVRAARINWSYAELDGDVPTTGKGTTWIDLADGTLVKVDAEIKNASIPDSPVPVDMKVLLELADAN